MMRVGRGVWCFVKSVGIDAASVVAVWWSLCVAGCCLLVVAGRLLRYCWLLLIVAVVVWCVLFAHVVRCVLCLDCCALPGWWYLLAVRV